MLEDELFNLGLRLEATLGRLEATTVREAAFFLGARPGSPDRRSLRRAEAALLLAGFEPTGGNGRWKRTDAGMSDFSPVTLRRFVREEDAHAPSE